MDIKRLTPLAGIAILFVLGIYLWFISIGPWRERGFTSDYYARLATSFRNGQLFLEEKPDPALLALPNPYDHKARKDVPVVGDASLYKGKYYLYFGPFPGAILALLPFRPGDPVFVYLFIIGLFGIQTLLLISISRRFFPEASVWIIGLGILTLGLTGPFLKMLSHPFIHEAAIAGGQFLFAAGLYFAFTALKDLPVRPARLVLASLFWSFSIATRTTQLVPVGFMVLLTWLYLFVEERKAGKPPQLWKPALALAAPLAACGVILAWYNWARFESIFEFGLYYQLAAFNLQANYDILFSRVYLIQNFYNYFLNPFELTGSFPFAYPLPGAEQPVLPFVELPNLYAVEGRFAGALLSTPVLLFSIIPILYLGTTFIERIKKGSKTDVFFNWTLTALLGSALAGAIPTLLLFYVGFRYETEFIASLTLLAVLGFSQSYLFLKDSNSRRSLAIILTGLVGFSVWVNISLAYTSLRG